MKCGKLKVFIFLLLAGLGIQAQGNLKTGLINLTNYWSGNYSVDVYFMAESGLNNVPKSTLNIDWGDGSAIGTLTLSGTWSDPFIPCHGRHYIANHTYSQGQFTITVVDSFLINDYTNIPNSGLQKLVLKRMFRSDVLSPIENSPFEFTSPSHMAMGRICSFDLGEALVVPGVYDYDNDSLAYSIVAHSEMPAYIVPPAHVTNLGLLTYTAPLAPGRYNTFMQVEEWRKHSFSSPASIIGLATMDMFTILDDCTSLPDDTETLEVKFSPQPCKGIINITGKDISEQTRCELWDSSGRKLSCNLQQNSQTSWQLNLSGYGNGLYYVKLSNQYGSKTGKIVVAD